MKNPATVRLAIADRLIEEANQQVFKKHGVMLMADGIVDQLGNVTQVTEIYFSRLVDGVPIRDSVDAIDTTAFNHASHPITKP